MSKRGRTKKGTIKKGFWLSACSGKIHVARPPKRKKKR